MHAIHSIDGQATAQQFVILDYEDKALDLSVHEQGEAAIEEPG